VEPGSYELTTELLGFAKQTSTVVVAAGQPVTLEVKLQIGGQMEQVQVTGSLIPRPTLEAMSPVTTLDIQELSYQGKTRLEDLLTSLPQVFTQQNSSVSNGASGTATVNLRNLGSQRTLVLLDGRRMPTGDTGAITADLNFIPSALVKRVDVLTGGASSVYGADAVAGVVNFILDRDFTVSRPGFRALVSAQQQRRAFAADHTPVGSPIRRVRRGMAVSGTPILRWQELPMARATPAPTSTTQDKRASEGQARLHELLRRHPRPRSPCGGSSTSPTGRFWTDDGTPDSAGQLVRALEFELRLQLRACQLHAAP
jgi:outer membrane receptor for ferrienterochelin and colicin